MPKRRFPITAPILQKLCVTLRSGVFGPYRDLLMEAALCLGWFGCLRCGEFTAQSSLYDPAIHLRMQDIVGHYDIATKKQLVSVNIKVSKTDPFRKGITVKLFETGHTLCPYTVLTKFVQIRRAMRASDVDPLFYLPECRILTRQVFVQNLRTLLTLIGQGDINHFSGHSLRRGMATSASAARVPDHVIAAMGRWSSDCYKTYIDTSNHAIASAQQSLAHMC